MGLLSGISLFSGIGGIDLALNPWVRTVCYVELGKYCQRVLQARIKDGLLDDAPIWDDVKTFDGKLWRGRVDIVFGGPPCQDVSVAGRREGLQEGNRTGLWYEMARLIGEIRPHYVFIENVSGLITAGLDKVLGSLASLGYDAEWLCLQAAEVGAPHRRNRVFILAHSQNMQCDGGNNNSRISLCGGTIPKSGDGGRAENMADASLWQNDEREQRDMVEEATGREGCDAALESRSEDVANGFCTGLEERQGIARDFSRQQQAVERSCFSADYWREDPADVSESSVGRLAHGVPKRVERLKALGNAVVPRQCRVAFDLLLHQAALDAGLTQESLDKLGKE